MISIHRQWLTYYTFCVDHISQIQPKDHQLRDTVCFGDNMNTGLLVSLQRNHHYSPKATVLWSLYFST